jgi:hypothetical protein
MRRFKWFLIVSFVLASSTLAWACGGGGGEKPSGPTAPAATSPAGKTPTVGEAPQAQAGGGEFSGLADKFDKVTFKVMYQVSTGGATPTQGSITWYKKGDNLRMDIAGGILGQQVSSILIIRPDSSYICSEGSCFEPPAITGGYSALVTQFEKALTDPRACPCTPRKSRWARRRRWRPLTSAAMSPIATSSRPTPSATSPALRRANSRGGGGGIRSLHLARTKMNRVTVTPGSAASTLRLRSGQASSACHYASPSPPDVPYRSLSLSEGAATEPSM